MGSKVIIMPDSFKGSMSSKTVATILGAQAEKHGFTPIELPVADGGEGSIDCILNILGGKKITMMVRGPEGKPIEAFYGITPDGTAIIEIAESSGITKQEKLHPMTADTYGFGELIHDALDRGYRKFLLCLGGSATTDCGLGMAAALGTRFYDVKGNEIQPCGEKLSDIAGIDISGLEPKIFDASFKVMSDVENPLYGEKGAAYIFSPQKGATETEVKLLDEGLRHVSTLVRDATGVDFEGLKGAGAAGGSGYGCAAFLKATITSGIHAMLDLYDFDSKASGCDFIITGEGKLDSQSLMGKVLSGIKSRAGDKRIVSFCGCLKADEEELKKQNITAVETGKDIPLEESIKNGERYLLEAAERFFENMEG